MNFEEALRIELLTIQDLNGLPEEDGKVFPLYAPKDTEAPFLVYKKENLKWRKTLGGTSNKAEGIYSLFVVTKIYSQLQQVSSEVVDKLLSFQGRSIGTGGPFIENITIEITGDNFEYEADLCREEIQIKINY